jgi:hypothetical protein
VLGSDGFSWGLIDSWKFRSRDRNLLTRRGLVDFVGISNMGFKFDLNWLLCGALSSNVLLLLFPVGALIIQNQETCVKNNGVGNLSDKRRNKDEAELVYREGE